MLWKEKNWGVLVFLTENTFVTSAGSGLKGSAMESKDRGSVRPLFIVVVQIHSC